MRIIECTLKHYSFYIEYSIYLQFFSESNIIYLIFFFYSKVKIISISYHNRKLIIIFNH